MVEEKKEAMTETGRPAEEPAAREPAQDAPAESAPEGDDTATAGDGGTATGPDGAPRKRRRRGKRGGRRHRKKPAGGEGAAGDEAAGDEADGDDGEPAEGDEATPAARAPRPRRPAGQGQGTRQGQATPRAPRAPRQPRPKPAAAEGEAPADEAVPAVEAEGVPEPEGAEGAEGAPPAARKRRRRRRGGAKKPGEGNGEAAATGEAPAKAEPKGRKPAAPVAHTSTRLAARAMRKDQQRGRRRPRRLTDEDVAALRGGEKVMLIHDHEDRTQIAVLEEGTLIEHYVARRGQRTSMAGNVFLGKVQNVLPSMEAAFVDFGRGRNGVLYAGEVNYAPEDLEEGAPPRIEKVLRSGQPLMVQVTKDPIGNKGARLTTQISLAGRYLVLAPEQHLTGISRRLSENERSRLRQILREIRPNGHGVIVRTAADGATKESLERDLNNLLKIWDQIQKGSKKHKAPHLLYAEPELVSKVVRDIFSGEFAQIVVDNRSTFVEIHTYLEDQAPELIDKLSLHDGPLPIFESYRVTEQLFKALERKVWLPSGGSLVLDKTEAMTVIDVNTGKFTGKGSNLEDTVYKNNLEAAEEVARQLRLRDIGGIIVIDFIDMIDPAHQKEVLRTLKRALSKDKTRSQVFDVTNLGLVEMTRKRVSEGLLEAFSEPCPNCEGRGIVMTHEID